MPKEKIDAKRFTKISNDWASMFPDYKKEVKGSFSKLVGPFSFSVYVILDRYQEAYSAYSCISPFLTENELMGAYLTTQPIRQNYLTWRDHEDRKRYLDAAHEIQDQTPFPLDGDVKVTDILNAYAKHSDEAGFYIKNCESPALLCGWCGKPKEAEPWIEWGKEKYLDLHDENLAYKKSIKGTIEDTRYSVKTSIEKINEWTEDLRRRVKDREYLHNLVESQIKNFKYDKFPRQDLIIDI